MEKIELEDRSYHKLYDLNVSLSKRSVYSIAFLQGDGVEKNEGISEMKQKFQKLADWIFEQKDIYPDVQMEKAEKYDLIEIIHDTVSLFETFSIKTDD